MSEVCPRCFTNMEWHHSSLHCPDCGYKAGFCEGESQSFDGAGRPGEGRPAVDGEGLFPAPGN